MINSDDTLCHNLILGIKHVYVGQALQNKCLEKTMKEFNLHNGLFNLIQLNNPLPE